MKRIVNKENTTDILRGKTATHMAEKHSLISLIYKALKQMSSLQSNSGHLSEQ